MKKFRDLKVGDLIATIRYELSQGNWGFTITEEEIIKINKRKRIFELASGRNMYVDSMMNVCEICWDFIICPNDEQNVNFAQKMLLAGMNMHRKKVYSDLQKFLVSCGAGYNPQGDLIIHN